MSPIFRFQYKLTEFVAISSSFLKKYIKNTVLLHRKFFFESYMIYSTHNINNDNSKHFAFKFLKVDEWAKCRVFEPNFKSLPWQTRSSNSSNNGNDGSIFGKLNEMRMRVCAHIIRSQLVMLHPHKMSELFSWDENEGCN